MRPRRRPRCSTASSIQDVSRLGKRTLLRSKRKKEGKRRRGFYRFMSTNHAQGPTNLPRIRKATATQTWSFETPSNGKGTTPQNTMYDSLKGGFTSYLYLHHCFEVGFFPRAPQDGVIPWDLQFFTLAISMIVTIVITSLLFSSCSHSSLDRELLTYVFFFFFFILFLSLGGHFQTLYREVLESLASSAMKACVIIAYSVPVLRISVTTLLTFRLTRQLMHTQNVALRRSVAHEAVYAHSMELSFPSSPRHMHCIRGVRC